MLSYEVVAFMICLAALFSYANHRFIRLSPTIGIMVLSLAFSVLLFATGKLMPSWAKPVIGVITGIDFHDLLMNVMLGFLLFAGSLHIDARSLRKELPAVIALSTIGILISTGLIGTALFYVFGMFHLPVPYIYCLLFAALISPTDPIAVLAILRQAGLPKSLELKIAGESLFNDGVAVVVFITILEVAQTGIDQLSGVDISLLFLREAGGGILFGLAIGYLSYRAMRSVDKYEVEVLITVATVCGGYIVAGLLHVSGPLAMVVAGILIGTKARTQVSEETRDYLNKFWELIDELLNALLFMLLGLEMLIVKQDVTILAISGITILIVLAARWLSVVIPITFLRRRMIFERHAVAILTWGGLRGGLSVALALSLPPQSYRDEFVAITYAVVVFSIIVQGLTIGTVYKRLK